MPEILKTSAPIPTQQIPDGFEPGAIGSGRKPWEGQLPPTTRGIVEFTGRGQLMGVTGERDIVYTSDHHVERRSRAVGRLRG